jgi:hypothetical protein
VSEVSELPDFRTTREVIESWLSERTGYSAEEHPWVRILAEDLLSELRAHFTAHYASPEEDAVFDFLNWLAPQHIRLVYWGKGSSHTVPEGELFERWKAERNG